MFNPPLDSSNSQWLTVNTFAAPRDLFHYLHYFDLNTPCDAIRVKVDIDLTDKDWNRAGEIIQYWQPENEKYQVKYSKIFLKEQTIIPIEPLVNSQILFRPVGWLYNWTIDVKARPYQPTEVGSVDLSAVTEQIALNQQVNTERYYRLIEAISNIEYLVEGVNDVVVEGFTERQPRELEDDERDLFGFS